MADDTNKPDPSSTPDVQSYSLSDIREWLIGRGAKPTPGNVSAARQLISADPSLMSATSGAQSTEGSGSTPTDTAPNGIGPRTTVTQSPLQGRNVDEAAMTRMMDSRDPVPSANSGQLQDVLSADTQSPPEGTGIIPDALAAGTAGVVGAKMLRDRAGPTSADRIEPTLGGAPNVGPVAPTGDGGNMIERVIARMLGQADAPQLGPRGVDTEGTITDAASKIEGAANPTVMKDAMRGRAMLRGARGVR